MEGCWFCSLETEVGNNPNVESSKHKLCNSFDFANL